MCTGWTARNNAARKAMLSLNSFIQVLQNLLSNALKFTESGSVVIHAERMDSGVRVQIEDTGIGIPTDQLDKIFGKFNQVDGTLTRKIGGTGLGLAICKAIVQEHGGNISVSSKIGKGSCFTIDLPDSNKYRHESESMEKEESAADLLLDEKQ